MDSREFEHMKRIRDYVFSTPRNSPERERRLAEISEEDSAKLYDFDIGLLSGRIKRPENQNNESEESGMNKEKKTITNYEDFKKALLRSASYRTLCEFKQSNPELYKKYIEKWEAERSK